MNSRLKSLSHAFRGLCDAVRNETNMKIHVIAAILVITLGLFLQLSSIEWLIVLFCIGLVISMETINTAIEKLADAISTDFHPKIKSAKDMAAGAVLISAIVAFIIGLLIFVPKLFQLYQTQA